MKLPKMPGPAVMHAGYSGRVSPTVAKAAKKLVGRKSALGKQLRKVTGKTPAGTMEKVNKLRVSRGVKHAAAGSLSRANYKGGVRHQMKEKLMSAGLMAGGKLKKTRE